MSGKQRGRPNNSWSGYIFKFSREIFYEHIRKGEDLRKDKKKWKFLVRKKFPRTNDLSNLIVCYRDYAYDFDYTNLDEFRTPAPKSYRTLAYGEICIIDPGSDLGVFPPLFDSNGDELKPIPGDYAIERVIKNEVIPTLPNRGDDFDSVREWLSRCSQPVPGYLIPRDGAYACYIEWCKRGAIISVPLNAFTRKINALGYKTEKRICRKRAFEGLYLH